MNTGDLLVVRWPKPIPLWHSNSMENKTIGWLAEGEFLIMIAPENRFRKEWGNLVFTKFGLCRINSVGWERVNV